MNMIFKVMIFSMMINFAAGFMIAVLPAQFDTQFDGVGLAGLEYTENYTADFRGEMEESINPGPGVEDQSDLLDRILDKLTMGIWSKFLNALDKYFYGLITMVHSVLGPHLDEGIRFFLFGDSDTFGILKWALNIAYVLGAVYLWTGRDLRV